MAATLSEPVGTYASECIDAPETKEILQVAALQLWNDLCRSDASGFFLPLSGGKNSAAIAAIVHSMCRIVVDKVRNGNGQVIADVQRITRDPYWVPNDPARLTKRLLNTCYMGDGRTSSPEAKLLAESIAAELGANHINANIDGVVEAFRQAAIDAINIVPRFEADGGCEVEDNALKAIQARSRIELSYFIAQLIPRTQPDKDGSPILLGASDQALSGDLGASHMYANIDPIEGIDDADLTSLLACAAKECDAPVLLEVLSADSAAKLQPMVEGEGS